MNHKIRDAYISVEIANDGLDCLRDGLRSHFDLSGIGCENASTAAHVSIAYGEGDVEIEALERITSEIAALPFSVHVSGFEILSGESTPFDYLVVALEGSSVHEAVSTASGQMKTKSFGGAFRSHLSLLKFPKGSISLEWAAQILGEMNACQLAARALGRPLVSLQGSLICVFTPDRTCCFSRSFAA